MRVLLSLTSVLTVAAGTALLASDWPSWRGPSNNGVSTETGLPVTWGASCAERRSSIVAMSNAGSRWTVLSPASARRRRWRMPAVSSWVKAR